MDAPSEKSVKLSSVDSIGFRPGPDLAAKIDALATEIATRGGKTNATLIIREGLLGCWTQVRTHLLLRHTVPPAQSEQVARFVAICGTAMQHGVTPEDLEAQLAALMERKLETV